VVLNIHCFADALKSKIILKKLLPPSAQDKTNLTPQLYLNFKI